MVIQSEVGLTAEYPATLKLYPGNSGYMDSPLRSPLRLRLGLGLGLGFEIRNKFIHKVPRSKFLNPTTTLVEKETHVVYLFL